MKYIHLKPFYGKAFLNNRVFNINSGHNIFYKLRDNLKKSNITIDTIDIHQNAKTNVTFYCDVPYPWQISQWVNIIFNNGKKILFTFESPLVNPFSHLKVLHIFFDRVYTWNDRLITSKKYKKFFIPQLDLYFLKSKKGHNKKLITLINSNKRSMFIFKYLSPYRADLYLYRQKIIRFFEKTTPNDFDLWGKGWKKAEYPSYKGTIAEGQKLKCLQNYKFAIAFENTNAPGYITEKIFDCFKSGVVPVYLGDPNIKDLIPKNSFVDMNSFADFESLYKYLRDISDSEYLRIQKRGAEFISAKSTQNKWSSDSFIKILMEETYSE